MLYKVVLESSGPLKVKTIKEVREATGCGLKEAKDLVESTPQTVKENLTLAEAEKLKNLLESMENTVRILDESGYDISQMEVSSCRCPMCGGTNVSDASAGIVGKLMSIISGKQYRNKCGNCGNKW